jgi:flavodoxin
LFGNTHRIAQAIARGVNAAGPRSAPGPGSDAEASEVRVVVAAELEQKAAADVAAWRPDLVLVGGPTVGRGMTRDLARVVDGIAPGLRGVAVAAFDTRLRGSELFMGSAAMRIAERLAKAGAEPVAPRECFLVGRIEPPAGERKGPQHVALEDGEEARAEQWGATVADAAGRRAGGVPR